MIHLFFYLFVYHSFSRPSEIVSLDARPLNITPNCMQSFFPELKELESVHNAIVNTNFATETELSAGACLRHKPFSEEEMQSWLKNSQTRTTTSRTVNGVAFENETEENLRAFDLLTTATDRYGKRDTTRKLVFNSSCKKVLCALENLFGKTVGTQMLFMQRKFGFNGSHLIAPGSAPWTKKELDTILLGLSDLPKGILPLEENKPLRKSSKQSFANRGAAETSANSIIEIFNVWTRLPPFMARATIVHEIGHGLADLTGLDETKAWKNLGGWQTSSESTKPQTLVSDYAGTDSAEDLAESVKAYRYAPEKLLRASPEKYKFIRWTVFNGVEYQNDSQCGSPVTYSDQIRKKAILRYKHWMPTDDELKKIASYCHGEAIEALYESEKVDLSSAPLKHCYKKAIQRYMKESMSSNRYLVPLLKNMEDIPFSGAQYNYFFTNIEQVHRQTLRDDLATTFSKASGFNPLCPEGKMSHLTDLFPGNSSEMMVIAERSCKGLRNNGSLKRLLPIPFGEKEIRDYVAKIVL